MEALTESTSGIALANTEHEREDMNSSTNPVRSEETTTPVVLEPKGEPHRICISCEMPDSSPLPLKRCAKCLTALYCSRECQRADWKFHKMTCAATGGPSIASSPISSARAPAPSTAQSSTRDPFGVFPEGKYLHTLSEKDAFTALIDSYRLRVEDEYVLGVGVSSESLYGNSKSPLPHFQKYLDLAESRDGILPRWWTQKKRMQCERLAVDESQWSHIKHGVKRSDIMEHYDDVLMPMKLRIVAEMIYSTTRY